MPSASMTESQKKAATSIGRALWSDAFRKQSPKATKEEKLASWKENRKVYVRLGRLSVRGLVKAGFNI